MTVFVFSIIRVSMGGRVAHVGERTGAYRVLEVIAKGKKLLEITGRSWEDNSKMGLKLFERALI
jgi:hypothetical protein